MGELVILNAIASKNDDIVANQISRMSHSRLKCLPHFLIIEGLLDFYDWLQLPPYRQVYIIYPDIRQTFGLGVLIIRYRPIRSICWILGLVLNHICIIFVGLIQFGTVFGILYRRLDILLSETHHQ